MPKKKKTEKNEPRKPKNLPFKQQYLTAYIPRIKPLYFIIFLLAVGITYLVLGIIFYIVNGKVPWLQVEYTDCISIENPSQTCAQVTSTGLGASCKCLIQFTLDEDWPYDKIYMYYYMQNYYQSNRNMYRSVEVLQMHGIDLNGATSCDPLINNESKSNIGSYYAPCGYLANSLFNDTITMQTSNGVSIPLTDSGIAVDYDANVYFKNPPGSTSNISSLPAAFGDTISPPNWPFRPYNFSHGSGQGYENEDFIVWMRTAAFSKFRKLYRTINQSGGLKAGIYQFNIEYNYHVSNFDGTKYIILTTSSFLGGYNYFIGLAYIVTGTFTIVFGIATILLQVLTPRKLGTFRAKQIEINPSLAHL